MIKRTFNILDEGIEVEMKSRYIERIGPEYDDPKLIAIAQEIDALFKDDTFGKVYRLKEKSVIFLTHDVDIERLLNELMARVKLIDEDGKVVKG